MHLNARAPNLTLRKFVALSARRTWCLHFAWASTRPLSPSLPFNASRMQGQLTSRKLVALVRVLGERARAHLSHTQKHTLAHARTFSLSVSLPPSLPPSFFLSRARSLSRPPALSLSRSLSRSLSPALSIGRKSNMYTTTPGIWSARGAPYYTRPPRSWRKKKTKKNTRNLERPLSSLLYFASSLLKKLITSFSPCMYIAENAYAVYVHDHIRVYIYVHNHIRGYTHTYMHVHRQNRVCCICT